MKSSLILSLAIAIILSMVVSKVIYVGFTPNYANDIFSPKAFNARFDHDVYKYRVLGKYMLFAMDRWLIPQIPDWSAENRILAGTDHGSQRFYYAFFYLNSLFLILTSIMVVLLLELDTNFKFSIAEKNLIIFLVPVLIGLSQFTVCCYDVSSYFFQLLILYIFLRWSKRYFWISMSTIAILIALSTLNRESAALSVSILAVLLLTRYGINGRSIGALALAAASFLITYIALHILIVDPTHQKIINIQAGHIFIDTNLMGLFFWIVFFYLPLVIADGRENRLLIGLFFLFSFPYIYTCLVDGVLWEIRLYIPLFLGALVLSKLDTSAEVWRIEDWKVYADIKRMVKLPSSW